MASIDGILSDARMAYATGSPHTWKKLEQLSDLEIPTLVADDIDTGVYGQQYKRKIPGLKDVNDAVATMLRDPSSVSAPNQNSLFALNENGTQLWIRIEVHASDNASEDLWEAYEFQGRVGSFEPAAPFGDKQTLKSVFKFSGTTFVRYAPAASQIG